MNMMFLNLPEKKKLCWDSLKSLQRNHYNSGTWGLFPQFPGTMQQILGMIKKWCEGTLNGLCMGSWLKKLLEGACIWARFLRKGEQHFGVTVVFLLELQQRWWGCKASHAAVLSWSTCTLAWWATCSDCSGFFFFLCETDTTSRSWQLKREWGKWLT